MMVLANVLAAISLLFALFLQYGLCRKLIVGKSLAIAEWLPLSLRYPTRDIAMVLSVALAGLTGCVVALAVSWVNDKNPFVLFTQHFSPEQIPFGVLLGLGEVAVSMLFSSLALYLFMPLRAKQIGAGIADELRAIGQAGWVRAYRKTLQILPGPLAWAVVALALLGEELLFRGIGVRFFAPDGLLIAMLASTLPFIAVQSLGMPSWFSSLPAMCGALVIGPVNAWLFLTIPNIIPLEIAHLTFFTVMIL